jgi:hypothetical protein
LRLTLIWQDTPRDCESDWIAEIFAPIAGDIVYDGKYSVVLDSCLLVDSYLHARPRDYYRNFRGKNAWLLHLSDETYEGGYDLYENFRGVFRTYWSAVFNPQRVMQIPLGYSAKVRSKAPLLASTARKYLWCFMGGANISSRPEMIRAFEVLEPAFLHATDRGNVSRIGKEHYVSILRDSVFVPSPMGNTNLDCFRVYEALECGSIPLLEKRFRFDYFRHLLGPHPLPTFTNWDKAAQFVRWMQEHPVEMDHLATECSQWWCEYKRHLSVDIERFVSEPAGVDSGSVQWYQSIPGWQVRELLRHHNLPAIARRISKQVVRLKTEGKLRKTFGA